MAIIGKIRSKSGLLVGFVFVSLAVFILSDQLNNKGGGGSDLSDSAAGEVFGTEINMQEYDQEVQARIAAARENAERTGQPYNEDMDDRIRDEVWNQRVNDIIWKKEIHNGFNVNVTTAELNDLLYGNNIPDYIKQSGMFNNSMGQFSVDSVKSLRQRIEMMDAQAKQWWVENIERPVKETRKITKYFNMVAKGMYVTKAEAERDHVDKNRRFKIRYVAQQFKDIPDSTIKVTDEDIREYYNKNKHRKKYESFGSRSFSYIEFLLVPTQEDYNEAKNRMEGLYERFKNSKNDSAFVMTYAETKMFNDQYSQPGQFPADVDSLVQKSDSGTIIGPFQQGDYWKMVKVRGVKTEPEARVRHILLSNDKGSMDVLKKRADSIINVIKKNNNFEEMVTTFSDDPGSKGTGGVYEWFPKGRMVKPFEDAAFDGKLNSLIKVETEYGLHIVEPLGRRESKRVKAATVDIKVRPMKETDMAVRGRAVDFLGKITESSKFQEIAQKEKLNVQTKDLAYNQTNIDGTQGTRALAIWVQNHMEGDLTDNPILVKGNEQMAMRMPGGQYDRYVVARLDNIREKGVPEFDDVKEIMKIEVIRKKKGEQLAQQMKGATSLEQLATTLKTTVRETEISFTSSSFPDLPEAGTEYSVIGTIFSMQKPGDMSVPIKGNNGTYVVVLTSITEAPALTNVEESRKMLTGIVRGNAQNVAYAALRELAKIQDNRKMN